MPEPIFMWRGVETVPDKDGKLDWCRRDYEVGTVWLFPVDEGEPANYVIITGPTYIESWFAERPPADANEYHYRHCNYKIHAAFLKGRREYTRDVPEDQWPVVYELQIPSRLSSSWFEGRTLTPLPDAGAAREFAAALRQAKSNLVEECRKRVEQVDGVIRLLTGDVSS